MLSNAIEHVLAIKEISVKIKGVELPEPTESAKITEVYKDQEPMLPEPNGSLSELILTDQYDAQSHPSR